MTLFVSYYFTPIDYCLDKLKKKYGYENEDQKHSVDADTRTLLQGVSCFGFIKKFFISPMKLITQNQFLFAMTFFKNYWFAETDFHEWDVNYLENKIRGAFEGWFGSRNISGNMSGDKALANLQC